MDWQACYSCRDYAQQRQDQLAQPLTDKANREKRDVIDIVDEFMLKAHDRHMAGTPLYPGGPVTITDPMISRLAALLAPGMGIEPLRKE